MQGRLLIQFEEQEMLCVQQAYNLTKAIKHATTLPQNPKRVTWEVRKEIECRNRLGGGEISTDSEAGNQEGFQEAGPRAPY